MRRWCLVWLGVLALVGSVTRAAVITVPGDFTTIQAAIVDANEGDVVVVGQGNYSEIDFLGKAITVRSSDPNDPEVVALTIIQGGGPVVSFVNGELGTSLLEGFAITGGINVGGNGGGVLLDQSHPTIRLCVIYGNSAASGAGIYADNSNAVIEHCEFYNNSTEGNGGGLACRLSSVVLFNCLIYANDAEKGGGVWSFMAGSVPELRNCTLTGNSASFRGGGLYCTAGSNPLVSDSIFWANDAVADGNEVYNESSIPVFDYCDVGGSGGSSGWDVSFGVDGGGNLDVDPNFVSGNFGDYYLAQMASGGSGDSPSIDTGSGLVDPNFVGRSTRTDEVGDANTVDMGYHYAVMADGDSDGTSNLSDNCASVSNPAQEDFDNDGVGDVCDSCPEDGADSDGDGFNDSCDNCSDDVNVDQADSDGDNIGDLCDNCVDTANEDQADSDDNGVGDACDEPYIVYEVIDLGTLGGASSFAYAINDANQVAGEARVNAFELHAFLWEEDANGPVMNDLGSLNEIIDDSAAYAINSAGQTAGVAVFTGFDPFNQWHGAFWDSGIVTDMGTLGTEHSRAEGINDSGQIVGHYRKVSQSRGFVWDNGAMTELGTLSGSSTKAYGVNNSGLIVGESRDGSARAFSAWVSDPNSLTDLGTLGGSSVARAVNDFGDGDIVGFSQVAGVYHAFIIPDGGVMEDLGQLIGDKSWAYGLNDAAQVVGSAEIFGVDHAILWEPNEAMLYKAVDLNERLLEGSGWSLLTEAQGINSAGNIVGHGIIGGQTHGFLMHPKPEPVLWMVPGDFATIQEAIDAAQDEDQVEIAAGVYTGPGNVDLDFSGKAITLGSSDPNDPNVVATVVIDCENSYRAFIFTTGETSSSTVQGLTILNGFATSGGGAIDCNSASPTIRYCVIKDCETLADGGAIFCRDSSPVISECTIQQCEAGGKGGAIGFVEGSGGSITDMLLENNTAQTGGGALYYDASDPFASRVIILHNEAVNGDGGGVICDNSSDPSFSDSEISNNTASGNGGGLCALAISSPSLTDCVVQNNRCSMAGGGCFSDGGGMQLTGCEIQINQAGEEGGGLSFQAGSAPTIHSTRISDNTSAMQGGGIYSRDSSASLKQCKIIGNQSQLEGGGLSFREGSADVKNCLINGNQTLSNGGAIYCEDVTTDFFNCTVSGNRASEGAGICSFIGSVGLVNCIFYLNEGGEVCGFSDPDPNFAYSAVSQAGEGNVNSDPNFVSPGFWDPNGTAGDPNDDFWVEGDYRLAAGSVAEDSGDPNRSYTGQLDLDELPREFGRVDMGAYELRRALAVPSETYATIQSAIDAAIDGDTVWVADGLYQGSGNRDLTFGSQAITVESETGSDHCVIDCQASTTQAHRGFLFESQNNALLVVKGFSIINGHSDFGGGIFCHKTSPTLRDCSVRACVANKSGGGLYLEESNVTLLNCELSGNRALLTGGAVNCYRYSDPNMVNCTVTGNRAVLRGGGLYCDWSSDPNLLNCIFWNNSAAEGAEIGLANVVFPSQIQISYSDVAGGQAGVFVDIGSTLNWGTGNIAVNPNVAVEGVWDPNGSADEADDFWINGDNHLQSQQGRWDPNQGDWVFDAVNSVGIDRGDLQSDWSNEPAPNGGRINMGVYGGSSQASLSGVCVAGDGDLTLNGVVDVDDLVMLVEAWLEISVGVEDMNCDGIVDWIDFSIMASAW